MPPNDQPDIATSTRKDDHLRIALETPVEVAAPIGFDAVRLWHEALPEMALSDVDPRVTFLGKELAFPLMVGSMTGGTAKAGQLNQVLAKAAARAGIGMFLGSQRVILEKPDTRGTFAVRDVAPDLRLLVGNIGAVQLNYGVGLPQIERLVASVNADALVFHLNPAQEAVQPEGDTDFRGLAQKLVDISHAVSFPVGLKEVGNGLSGRSLQRVRAGCWAFVESAGAGGTSWTLIEGRRRPGTDTEGLGDLFAGWGIPSVTSILSCVEHAGDAAVVASGGIRTGIDCVKALCIGASVTAMALPLLVAADKGVDAAYDAMMFYRDAVVRAMFLVGARTVADLRSVPRRVHPDALPSNFVRRRF